MLTDQVLIDSTFHSNINNYFNSFLTVSFDGVKNKLNFLGLENKNEMFVFYLEIEKLPSFNVISLDNKLLFDLYSEQQKIIMNCKKIVLLVLGFFVSFVGFSQDAKERNQENINVNKFRQLYQEFSSPNMFRTASGAPGPAYYQQQADYKMDIELDDENKRIYGSETITYTNNSPDNLEYLWVQLDQNIRKKDSPSLLIDGGGVSPAYLPSGFTKEFLTDSFDGGFNIEYVVDENKNPLKHFVNQTMMRVDLPNILKSGESFSFSIKWWYNIQDHVNQDGRSGYESFDKDGNRVYIIAQFFPRMAPKEGNPLWEDYSTVVVAETLKTYSDYTFDYPYHKAISVHAKQIGMEYPMICFNFGRPNIDGSYSDDVKFGMIGVIIHEVGHNWFPMIVNNDERQWAWMDEGINTFVQYITEQKLGKDIPEIIYPLENFPSDRGPANMITRYMGVDQNFLAPIMSNPENVYSLGPNAYGKPATALNILRETVMGKELFDHAFKTYSKRWMFKHPSPEDFFRTMEDASAVDLDWFWRGWFYTTDYVDIGIKEVNQYFVSNEPSVAVKKIMEERGITKLRPLVFLENFENDTNSIKDKDPLDNSKLLNENFTESEISNLEVPKYFYEIVFDKPGGLVMPIIVDFEYEDGTKQRITYPAQVWRKNDNEVKKLITSNKKIININLDPDLETADIDTSNNSWPKKQDESEFDKFKSKVKG